VLVGAPSPPRPSTPSSGRWGRIVSSTARLTLRSSEPSHRSTPQLMGSEEGHLLRSQSGSALRHARVAAKGPVRAVFDGFSFRRQEAILRPARQAAQVTDRYKSLSAA